MPLYKLSWYGDDDISAAHASLFDGKLETYQNKMHDIMLKNKNLCLLKKSSCFQFISTRLDYNISDF